MIVKERILNEFETELLRPIFKLPKKEVLNIIEGLRSISTYAPAYDGHITLPDEGDEPFLEASLSARADAIVTGNKRHFPSDRCKGVSFFHQRFF